MAVVIPTHNRAPLLPAALDSVVAQTFLRGGGRVEAAVVDDGSTDGTAAVLAPYLERYAADGPLTVRCTRLQKAGVVAARNAAIAQTSAPLVAFLDSDDFWDPPKLERQVAVLRQRPEVGVVHTSFRYVNDAGRAVHGPGAPGQRPDNPCHGRCLPALLKEDLVIFSSVLMRRGVIQQAAAAEAHGQPFDPRFTNAQDYDLLLRAARLCEFAYLAEPLVSYRLHPGHAAMGNLRRAFGFHCRVQMDFVRRHGAELGLDDAAARTLAGDFLFGRAHALFWQRDLKAAGDLCALARELGVADHRFPRLETRLARPAWLYRIKDALDRARGR